MSTAITLYRVLCYPCVGMAHEIERLDLVWIGEDQHGERHFEFDGTCRPESEWRAVAAETVPAALELRLAQAREERQAALRAKRIADDHIKRLTAALADGGAAPDAGGPAAGMGGE